MAEFEKLNALPTPCGILSSGMSDNTIESCMVNKASWYRSCHQRFSNSKLQRGKERKRKLDAEIENGNEIRGKGGSFMNIAHFLLAILLRIWH